MKNLFDTHAHLLDRRLRNIKGAAAGVNRAICVFQPGEGLEEYRLILREKSIFGAAGVHPHSAKDFQLLEKELILALEHPKTVALGETGLDFYYDNSPRDIQEEVFIRQLRIACEINLPVIIHSRDAFEKTLRILDETAPASVLIHCFTGTAEEMRRYIERGFYIAVGGVVTFPSASGLAGAVKEAPLERVLLETDCPYMSPVPMRGKTNTPDNLKYIASRVAELKSITAEEVALRTYENALKFFRIESNDKK